MYLHPSSHKCSAAACSAAACSAAACSAAACSATACSTLYVRVVITVSSMSYCLLVTQLGHSEE